MEPTLTPLTRDRVAKHFLLPSRAKQSFLKETDINNIMRKFEANGLLEHLNTHQGNYGDFIGYDDYQLSLNLILDAEKAFSTIPAKIRATFNNDPVQFLEFAQNPENLDQMIVLGLARPRPTEPGTGEVGPGAPSTPSNSDPTPSASPTPGETTSGAESGATG